MKTIENSHATYKPTTLVHTPPPLTTTRWRLSVNEIRKAREIFIKNKTLFLKSSYKTFLNVSKEI